MPNDVINTVTIHGTTYGIGGSGGHTIKNPAGTAMTQRSNLQFVDLTVSDDSTNDATKVESVHVIHSESELNNLPDGLYMLDEDEETVIDGNLVGYDNTTSGLNAENIQDAIDEVVETLDDKADKVSSATNGNLAGLNSSGNLTDSGVAASEIPALWKSQGEYGVKNLIPYPYYDGMSKTHQGITYTVNADGSVTAVGTASNNSFFNLVSELVLPSGDYILTGDLDTETTYGATAILFNENTASGASHWNYGKNAPCSFTIASSGGYTIASLRIRITSGTTVNQTFYPMIRVAADTDETYRPYAKTNKQLTDEVAENTEDIDTLENRTDNTTTSISGNPISITGLKSNQLAIDPIITLEPIQDLHGQSKPYPAGGGKNLLPLTVDGIKAVNTSGTWSSNAYTLNNVTFTILTDASNNITGIKVNGTSNNSSRLYFPVSSFTSDIIFSLSSNKSSGTTIPAIYVTNIGTSVSISNPLNISANTTLGSTFINISTSGVSVDNVILYPMIRLSTVSDATFAPYENICPISGYDKIEVLSCGVNVWDEQWELGAYSATDGSAITSTNSIRSKSTNYILIAPNKSYYMKYPGGYNLNVCYYDANKVFISNQVITASGIITTPTTAKYIRFNLSATYGTTYGNNISINYPSTDTDYHTYHKATSISESLGQTVYGATWYPRTGVLMVTHKAVKLNTLSWIYYSQGSQFYADISDKASGQSNVISSIYKTENSSADFTIIGHPSMGRVHIRDTQYNGDITNWLNATGDQTVCYKLATPFEIQLTPHEISLLKDYAYVSTNGTTIALDYHNGELASLADVSQLGETVNELGEYFAYVENVSSKITMSSSALQNQLKAYKIGRFVHICLYTGAVASANTTITLGRVGASLLNTNANVCGSIGAQTGNDVGAGSIVIDNSSGDIKLIYSKTTTYSLLASFTYILP